MQHCFAIPIQTHFAMLSKFLSCMILQCEILIMHDGALLVAKQCYRHHIQKDLVEGLISSVSRLLT